MIGYAEELIKHGKRADNRAFDEFRDIEIKPNHIEKAEGSAYVRIGKTQVIAGVKMGVGTPFADTPNEGVLMVNTEFSPLASPKFESGPPSEDAIELARIVDRGIRESHCIEMSKLAIIPGEKVWSVFIDIFVMDHQGNLQDAAALAAITALLNTRFPKLDENNKIITGEHEGKLPVVKKPVSVTVCKAGDKLFVDPALDEEGIVDSKMALGFVDDDIICAIQKQGNVGIEYDMIDSIIDLGMRKAKELRKLVR
ncbi:MAG: exosome complex protein Rrp42 [Candidatus Aenigmarchaeota archaeon]|nr:exosome complex protein Rrp42 [Candidatus Aenigmarchaeota archaeon]